MVWGKTPKPHQLTPQMRLAQRLAIYDFCKENDILYKGTLTQEQIENNPELRNDSLYKLSIRVFESIRDDPENSKEYLERILIRQERDVREGFLRPKQLTS